MSIYLPKKSRRPFVPASFIVHAAVDGAAIFSFVVVLLILIASW